MEAYKKEDVIHLDRIPASIKHQQLSGRECYCPLHWHKDIEINLFLMGDAEFWINGVKHNFEPGDFVLINSGDIHQGNTPDSVPEKERYQELVTIQLDYDFLNDYYNQEKSLRFTTAIPENIRAELRHKIIRIGVLYIEKPLYFEMKITALLLEVGSLLLEYCVESETAILANFSNKTFRQIQHAVDYIEENYQEPLFLPDIAQQMGWAPTYFSRKFKLLTGITYHDYLVQCRLKHAYDNLTNTDKNITQIAYDCGFPNVKSFIEIFKKYYHVTPQQYRLKL